MTCTTPTTPDKRLANEQQAIAQLKHGNLAGLALLVETYQVQAVHTALLIIGDRGAAEEVVQEAFLRAYRKINQFDDRRPFGPWFLRSVINAALKAAVQQKRAETLEEPQNGSRTAEWLIDPSPGLQEIAETAEVREAIWQALEQLTPDKRAAVVLRYFLDESENEMIRELNRPRTTVKWWLHAARQRLRQILQPFHTVEMENQEVECEQE
ncbi:MAG: RNA polymerase subunit sigma-24 [Chloroflexi bacterium HGW-Chloroflexi-10]|nr:MAG: RNA polymerase subunit sigma-24 [Chloroflexi bacterium HGW-Chloroflexi-10]